LADLNENAESGSRVAARLERLRELELPGEVFTGDVARRLEEAVSRGDILEWWRSLLDGRRDGRSPKTLFFYLHVPFCRSRCRYCQFDSIVAADGFAITRYIGDVQAEARRFSRALGRVGVTSVSIGGGTPSLLDPNQIDRLAGVLFDGFLDLPAGAWFSVEMNPDTTTPAKVAAFIRAGADRFSLGVQSLSRLALKRAGRAYPGFSSLRSAVDAVRSQSAGARAAVALNLDFLAPLSGETPESLADGLGRALELEPDSVTLYRYQPVQQQGRLVEPGPMPFEEASRALIKAGMPAGYPVFVETRTSTILMRETPDSLRPRYDQHPDFPASVMAFGPFAESHVYGRGIYRTEFGRDGGLVHVGTRVDDGYECRSHAARLVAGMRPIDTGEFERRFGVEFRARFAPELELMRELGKVDVKGEMIVPVFGDRAEAGLFAGLMFDDAILERIARLYAGD